MPAKTILLIGLSEAKTDLLDMFQSDNIRLLAYVGQENNLSILAIAETFGIELHHSPGVWLKDVDIIIPLLIAGHAKECAAVMQDYQRLDLALQEFQEFRGTDALQPCWIETIEPDDASPELLSMYQSLETAHGKIHNLYKAFSLQPAPLIAADQHYRAILHNEANQSDPWFLELLSCQVAILARCTYALANHGVNFKKLLGDEALGDAMLNAVRQGELENSDLFNAKQSAFLKFGEKLAVCPNHMEKTDIAALKTAGAGDTEILEAVQAMACFSYWSRLINALGINPGDEAIGRQDI